MHSRVSKEKLQGCQIRSRSKILSFSKGNKLPVHHVSCAMKVTMEYTLPFYLPLHKSVTITECMLRRYKSFKMLVFVCSCDVDDDCNQLISISLNKVMK